MLHSFFWTPTTLSSYTDRRNEGGVAEAMQAAGLPLVVVTDWDEITAQTLSVWAAEHSSIAFEIAMAAADIAMKATDERDHFDGGVPVPAVPTSHSTDEDKEAESVAASAVSTTAPSSTSDVCGSSGRDLLDRMTNSFWFNRCCSHAGIVY